MECSICYEVSKRSINLLCGHSFCKECTTKWCKEGVNENCPTCRKPIKFKGFSRLREIWSAEKEESQFTEKFSDLIDGMFEYAKYLRTRDYSDIDSFESYEEYLDCRLMKKFDRRGRCFVLYCIKTEEKEYNKWKDMGVDPEYIFDYMREGVVVYDPEIISDPIKPRISYKRPTHCPVI